MPRASLKDALRILKHPNFRLFFAGQLVSTTGTYMQAVAQSWLVYRLTGSAALLGLIVFSGQISVFVLAPLSGTLADRVSRRRVLLVTESASMALSFLLAALTLMGEVRVWQVFAIAAALGVANAFNFPARQAFVADIVEKEELIRAIPLNSAMINTARILGPSLAGLLVAAIGEGWCFLINGVSYVAVIAGLLLMKISTPKRDRRGASVIKNISEGFQFVARSGPDLALLALLGLVSFWGMRFEVLMPIFVDKILHAGPRGLGLLMGATGVGAVLGSLILAAQDRMRELGGWVAFSSAGFGASLILFAISRSFWLSVVLIAASGMAMVAQLDSSSTLIQEMVPDALRGRVTAIWTMMLTGMGPFGALIVGMLANHFGAPRTMAAGGAACLMGATVFGFYLPIFTRKAVASMETADAAERSG